MRVLGAALTHDDVVTLTIEPDNWYCALLADGWRKYLQVGADGVSRVILLAPYRTLSLARGKQWYREEVPRLRAQGIL